ncbi:MAG: hypothetical protein AB7O97_08360 [Planctomycetota bacterium]
MSESNPLAVPAPPRRTPLLPSAVLLLLPLAVAAPAQSRAPAPGPGDLECKVTAHRVPFAGSLLFEVEVRNAAAQTAEPVLFLARFGKDGPAHRIERCPMPYAGRHGRGIAPGGIGRYHLQLAGEGSPKTLRVEVAAATFRDGAADAPAPVTVGELRQGSVMLGNREVAATYVGLRNASELPVDVVLLGTFARPHEGQALLTARLPAHHDGEVDFERQPAALDWNGTATAHEGVELVAAEVVDWTAFDRDALDTGAPAETVAAAYRSWCRWPEPWPSGSGVFGGVYSRSTVGGGEVRPLHGTFELKDVAPPMIQADGKLGLQALEALDRGLDAAFGDLRRWAPAVFEKEHTVTVMDRGRYLLDGPGLGDRFGKLVDVEDGRFTRVADASSPVGNWQRWLLRRVGDGYLVAARDTVQWDVSERPVRLERRVHGRLGDWIVPLSYRLERWNGEFHERLELQVRTTDLLARGQRPPTAPGGPAGDALQAAWEHGYRYPDTPAPLQAKLLVTPDGDAAWLGRKRLKGDLLVPGFTGFRHDGQGLWPRTVEVEDRGDDDRPALAAAIGEHLLRWAVCDFAGRPPFATAFAGGVVLADQDRAGVFTIGNCAIAEVEVRDGLVVRVRWRDGDERHITWGKERDAMVPTEIRTGDQVAHAQWKKIDATWYLPVSIRVARWCDPDPGECTLQLQRPKLK